MVRLIEIPDCPALWRFQSTISELIEEAADACPVEVIKFELIADEAETEAPAEAPAVEAAVETAPAAAAVGT